MLPTGGYRAFPFQLNTLVHTQPFREGVISIGPVGGAAIVGLAALGLLLHAVGLAALTWTPLQEKSQFSHQVQDSKLIKWKFQISKLLCSHQLLCKKYKSKVSPVLSFSSNKRWKSQIFDHEKTTVHAVYLSVLCEMMVQQLGVGLLVWWEDMQEGSRGITRSTSRVQGPRSSQR